MISSLIIGFLIILNLTIAFHDSLNLVVEPQQRQCFYEDFNELSPQYTVEAFVQSGGHLDLILQVYFKTHNICV